LASKSNSYEKNFLKEQRKRKIQQSKKALKRNREDRSPRKRDWVDLLDADDIVADYTFERVMPLDERDRRLSVETLVDNGVVAEDDAALVMDGAQGRVIEVSSGLCRVEIDGSVWLCTMRGSLSSEDSGYTNVVAVGDFVVATETDAAKGVVEQVLPRNNVIARPDPGYGHLQQILVANVDQLLIVASWRNPNIWTELIDRYLITAERHAIQPVICVNKIDLAADMAVVESVLRPYRALEYPIIVTSAERGDGLDRLRETLCGKITVLAGLSGVGKSSLLRAAQPGFELRTGEVNERLDEGRHTTTQATMLKYGEEGYVIDTPGIREFGLYGLARSELAMFYPEIIAQSVACRFADCTHVHEPDCAVRQAVDDGKIDAQRYENYGKILENLHK
jgi:ribosome biogenesis GTPase